ncbi:MAG: glycosyltransferase, partial [Oscillospiraceae bacterium]|nr:glycosyltransferase [Oscillospiraceae bacterium]
MEGKRTSINMLSKAHKVKAQGVGSVYEEHAALMRESLPDRFELHEGKASCMDIMHYHTINLRYYLFLTFAKMRGRAVGMVHFLPETVKGSVRLPGPVGPIFYRYMVSFYKRMHHLVTVSPAFTERLCELGVRRDRITYIPNHVSDKGFHEMDPEGKARERRAFGIGEGAFVVLSVGQVQTRKGVADFIEIARSMPDCAFVWAGGFSFGAMTEGYRELKAHMEDPPPNVTFTGIIPRERMNGLYNAADVFMLPSYGELFPMCVMEAV